MKFADPIAKTSEQVYTFVVQKNYVIWEFATWVKSVPD